MKLFLFLILISYQTLSYADLMNLNDYMPTRLEDASPIDKDSWDIQQSIQLEKNNEDVVTHRTSIRYGVNEHLQFEAQGTHLSGDDERGSGETLINALYQFNRSENYLPEVSFGTNFILPTGKSNEGLDYAVKTNFTTTLSGTSDNPIMQIHLNVQIQHNQKPHASDRIDQGFYALGISRLIGKYSSIVADLLYEEKSDKKSEHLILEVGLHQHLGKEYYLGLGVGRGYERYHPVTTGILALEKQIN